ncbi:MAG: protein kinase, partial [Longimicrobiales bacterium]
MSETAAVPLEPGRRFGDFDLIRRLGAGGGGEVWEARERRADRVVALKVLTHLRAESAEARARFEREARLAAGFRHPRVVYVLGGHDIEGLPCISMELMRGGTLTDLLQAGPPP